tara:strand:+ start:3244 stop:4320 length:1077 start_codon:yes stop_codon:yes gene_type:complete
MILTYKKYLLTVFNKSLIQVLTVFFFLIVISNLFEELSFVEKLNLNVLYPLFLSLLNSPSIIFDILPFIFLITTQFFFISLNERDEFSIFKLNGLTNFKILNLLTLYSFLIGIVSILFFYTLSSNLKNYYLETKNNLTSDKKYLAVITNNGVWIKDEINQMISITNADKIDGNYLIDVSIVQFDQDFKLIKTIKSKRVNISNKKWMIKEATISQNNNHNEAENLSFNSNFDEEKINNLFSNLSSFSFWELEKLKKDYQTLGYSTREILVYKNKIYSIPFYLAIMTLISGIIMFNSKYKKSKVINILIGIFLSVIIYYANYFSSLLGSSEKIPIILSIWLPLIILSLFCMIGLVRVNDK